MPSVHFPEKLIQATLSPPAAPQTQPMLLHTENQGLDVQDNSSGYKHNKFTQGMAQEGHSWGRLGLGSV